MRTRSAGLVLVLSLAVTAGCLDDEIGHHRQALNDGGPTPPPDAFLPPDADGGGGMGSGDIDLSPTSYAFGDVRVFDLATGAVDIRNTAASTLVVHTVMLSGSTVFSQSPVATPLSISPGSFYRHSFSCQPLGVGTHTGTISITSSDPDESTVSLPLSCRGVKPDILLSPTSLAFGGVPVGGSSSAMRVTVSNANQPTTSTLTVSGVSLVGANATNFSKSGPCATSCVLAPGASSYVDVVFTPTAVGPRSAALRLTSNDVETPSTDVPLSGTGQQQNIVLSQPSNGTLAFGDVNVGQTSSQQPVTVRNDGNLALSITGVSLLGANASSFAISNGQVPPPSFQIGAGGQTSWLITCTPATAGAKSAIFRVASDDPDQPNTDVTLTCNGTQSSLAVDPSPVSFGVHRVGEPAQTVNLTLQNTGGASLTVNALSLTGDPEISILSAPALPVVLSNGDTTSLTLAFAPSASATFSATLAIASSDPNSPTNVAISGTGEEAALEVTPASPVDLGPICAGLDTDTSFSIASVGTGPFEVKSIAALPAVFTVDMISQSLPVTLDGTNPLDFRLRARPTGTGLLAGQISIETDLPASPTVIEVSATGIAAGLAAAPQAIDFGSVAVGEDSAARRLTFTNCDGAAVTITGVDLTGGDAIGFRIDSGPRPPPEEPVARTESRRWDVVFQPGRGGSHVAALTIATTGGDLVIPLSGSATGGNPDGGAGGADAGAGGDGGPGSGADGDNTYYACAVSGAPPPFTLILVGLALVAVTRRRSRGR